MVVKYNISKLKQALNDFYNVTGIRSSFHDTSFSHLTTTDATQPDFCGIIQGQYCNNKCFCNDRILLEKCKNTKAPVHHTCHAGLIDIAIPILNGENILGYLLLGQIRQNAEFKDIKKNLSAYKNSFTDLENAYNKLILYNENKIQSLISLCSMLASYILTDSMAHQQQSIIIEKCVNYINNHLGDSITVADLCKTANISKNSLYKYFDEFFGCTINHYITIKRLDTARIKILETETSLKDICFECGFENYSYFCKVFKKHFGVSPILYKKKSLY